MGWLSTACVVLALVTGTARAEDGSEPWAAGVAEADRARASAIFQEGVHTLGQPTPEAAIEKYREALAIWDHPVIRFNLIMALVRLDRIVEAADAFDTVLRFGQAPFTPQMWSQLLDYKKLIFGRVGEIEGTCTQDGAQLILDGQVWFACPGTRKLRVLAGEHIVTATHPNMSAKPEHLLVSHGGVSTVHVDVLPMNRAFTFERRFPVWLPWTVLGAGVAGLAGGVVLALVAQDKMNDYDQAVASSCAVNGCDFQNPDPSQQDLVDRLNEQRASAELTNEASVAVLAVAGVGVVAGIVLVVLNSPVRRPIVDAKVTADGGAATVRWSF